MVKGFPAQERAQPSREKSDTGVVPAASSPPRAVRPRARSEPRHFHQGVLRSGHHTAQVPVGIEGLPTKSARIQTFRADSAVDFAGFLVFSPIDFTAFSLCFPVDFAGF